MSPRAFQTIIVAAMGNKDRLELESRVLAAALKQSFERGDTYGVSLAHRQIFLLLKAQQAAAEPDSAVPDNTGPDKEGNGIQARDRPADGAIAPPSLAPGIEIDQPGASAHKDEDGVTTGGQSLPKKRRSLPDIVWEPDNASFEPAEVESSPTPAAPEVAGQAAGEEVERPSFDAYGLLQVEQSATFDEIHIAFLRLARRVLFALNAKKVKRKQRMPLLDELRDLWIAHDILTDPVTRTDFDFRMLGLRGAPNALVTQMTDAPDEAAAFSTRTPLRVGELMQCAGLLEATELEIAADMHKAMPEMLFGAFLVKQGFISDEDLGQVLIGQWLLKNGNMTVANYQALMKIWREEHIPLDQTAVEQGYVSETEMERLVVAFIQDTKTSVPTIRSLSLPPTAPRINAEEAAKRTFRADNAVPIWKDQLDWSAAPEPVSRGEDNIEIERRPLESSVEIEGITDAVSKDAGKKSLRRLMEGIHSPEGPSDEQSGKNLSLKGILSGAAETLPGPSERLESPDQSPAADTIDSGQTVETSSEPAALAQESSLSIQSGGTSSPTDPNLAPPAVASSAAAIPLDITYPPHQAVVLPETSFKQLQVPSKPSGLDRPVGEPVPELPFSLSRRRARAQQFLPDDFEFEDFDDDDVALDADFFLGYEETGKRSRKPIDLAAVGAYLSPSPEAPPLGMEPSSVAPPSIDEEANKERVESPSPPVVQPPYVDNSTYLAAEEAALSAQILASEANYSEYQKSGSWTQIASGLEEVARGIKPASSDEKSDTEKHEAGGRSKTTDELATAQNFKSSDTSSEGGQSDEDESLQFRPKIKPVPPPLNTQENLSRQAVKRTAELEPLRIRPVTRISLHKPDNDAREGKESEEPNKERTDGVVKDYSRQVTQDVAFDAKKIEEDLGSFQNEIKNLDQAIEDVEAELDGMERGAPAAHEEIDRDDEVTEETYAAGESAARGQDKAEWQLVYKLEGQIADMFLSDKQEEEMKKLRPRLTQIDSIIPDSHNRHPDVDSGKASDAESGASQDNQEGESDSD